LLPARRLGYHEDHHGHYSYYQEHAHACSGLKKSPANWKLLRESSNIITEPKLNVHMLFLQVGFGLHVTHKKKSCQSSEINDTVALS
jgi:hypothetical protein